MSKQLSSIYDNLKSHWSPYTAMSLVPLLLILATTTTTTTFSFCLITLFSTVSSSWTAYPKRDLFTIFTVPSHKPTALLVTHSTL